MLRFTSQPGDPNDYFLIKQNSDIDPFGIGESTLSSDVTDFINRRPIWMLYARRDLRFPCITCYDPTTNSPKKDCPDCLGTGFSLKVERHKTRLDMQVLPNTNQLSMPGYLPSYPVVIYTPRDNYPKREDLYFEVEWDVDLPFIGEEGRPARVLNTYRIAMLAVFRQDEVTYFGCGCNVYDLDIEFLENTVLHRQL